MINKKKGTLLFLVLLSIIPLRAQVISGEVDYRQRVIDNVFDSIVVKKINVKYRKELDFINESLRDYSNNFQFKLKFNRIESIYKAIDKMQNDADKGYRIAAKFSRVNDVYYVNMQSSEKLVQKESFGKLFVIKYGLNSIKWKLFNKTKTIKNYKCFMATTIKIVKNSKGVFKKPVIAWYSPEIPLNYGPKGYGNLPGLILELQEDKLKFYATKIKLNLKKKIEIKKPNRGEFITDKEFELKIKKISSSFWKNK